MLYEQTPQPEPERLVVMSTVTEGEVREWSELVESKRSGGKSARKAASKRMAEFLRERAYSLGGSVTESQLRSELNQAMQCGAQGLRAVPARALASSSPTLETGRQRAGRSSERSAGSSDEPRLYTIQHRHKAAADDRVLEQVQYVLPNEACAPSSPISLGALDARFAQEGRRPTLVTLLLVFPEVLDQGRLITAVEAALTEFPAACGRRVGSTIISGPGVRFSATTVERETLHTRPPPRCLFDPPSQQYGLSTSSDDYSEGAAGTEVLTLRLATEQAGQQCSIGVCFDHALCDISGVALWLSHVSTHYSGRPSAPPPPRPHHVRHEQARIVARCEGQRSDQRECQGSLAERDCQPIPRKTTCALPVAKGGCVCVEWAYTAADLRQLKDTYEAYSRHDACFADVLVLLRGVEASSGAAGTSSITSVTISRDDRAIADVPIEHFGNGIVLVKASLPQNADASGSEIAAALRSAIRDGQGVFEVNTADGEPGATADVHLNTWWHPLQKAMDCGVCTSKDGGETAQPTFAIGSLSLAGAGQMCLSRGGQPNVTVLPASGSSGFTVYLLCPLDVGHAVLRQLRERRKSLKKAQQREMKEQSLATGKPLAAKSGVATLTPGNSLARVVWFHGLGDTSGNWHRRFGEEFLAQIGGSGSFIQPSAPERIVTARLDAEGPVPAWFDINALPVKAETELEHLSGLEEAVENAHRLIDAVIKKEGVEPGDVIVGGFSQGGALAILAGMSYPKRLAGIVSMSGWCPCQTATALAKRWLLPKNSDDDRSAEHTTMEVPPIFFSCGTADPTVDYKLSKQSIAILRQAVGEEKHSGDGGHVVIHTQQRAKHPPHQSELTAAVNFMIEHTRSSRAVHVDTDALAPLPGGWRCSGETNAEMVSNLERAGLITVPLVATAMRATDRAYYVPHTESTGENTQRPQQQDSQHKRKNKSKTYQYGPYCDAPQSLGFKATISAPHMHAKALDLLAEHLLRSRDVGGGIECGFRALDVGSGSGVLVALFARILRGIAVADTAHTAAEDVAASSDGTTGITEQRRSIVVGIEVVPELVQTSINNLRRDGFHPNDHENGASEHSNQELAQHRARSDPQIVVRQGNGWSAGTAEGSAAAEFGPFDVIHVGAAAPGPGIPPGLKQLLKPGGRMILPIGARGAQQRWTMVDRSVSEQYSMMSISGVRFVPLVEDV